MFDLENQLRMCSCIGKPQYDFIFCHDLEVFDPFFGKCLLDPHGGQIGSGRFLSSIIYLYIYIHFFYTLQLICTIIIVDVQL